MDERMKILLYFSIMKFVCLRMNWSFKNVDHDEAVEHYLCEMMMYSC